MGRPGYPTKRGNCGGGGSLCKSEILNFPLLLDKSKYWEIAHFGKKGLSNSFQISFTKILPLVCIQLDNYDLSQKAKSLNTKPCPAGLSPGIICQASPFLLKMSRNCCTYKVMWTVHPFPETLWVTLGMGKNPTQQPKTYSFPPSEKSHLIDLNLSPSKVSFLPHHTVIFK